MVMKTYLYFVLCLLLSVMMLSCVDSLSLDAPTDSMELMGVEANSPYSDTALTKATDVPFCERNALIEDGYVQLKGNQYFISITRNSAIENGYAAEDFDSLEKSIQGLNNMINDIIHEYTSRRKDISISVEDYTYVKSEDELPMLPGIQSRAEINVNIPIPSGSLSAYDQTPVYTRIFAPANMVAISGHCYQNTIPDTGHVVTTSFFTVLKIASRLGSGPLYVELGASNTYGEISYRTQCSNGGIFSYSGSMKVF